MFMFAFICKINFNLIKDKTREMIFEILILSGIKEYFDLFDELCLQLSA